MTTLDAHILDILRARAGGSVRSTRMTMREVQTLMLSRFQEEATAKQVRSSVQSLVRSHRLTWHKIDNGVLYFIP